MNKGIIAKVNWKSKNVVLGERVFLFCFDEKCMSGKITNLKKLEPNDEFKIEVSFIDPIFFKTEATVGKYFTIQEASKILGNGKIEIVI